MASLTSDKVCNINNVSYNAGIRCCALGACVCCGNLIAKRGGFALIVAPASTEQSRIWDNRAAVASLPDGGTAAGWYIPSRSEFVYGVNCRTYWTSPKNTFYWSDSVYSTHNAWVVCLNKNGCHRRGKNYFTACVRAFRKVYY